ncbi:MULTISPECIES: ABC transporter ATP-binding protein [Arthrobacter]|uniref:ABC transporter ATP-binding protein n=1 Tax=Arthrobacter caoxuetaonis TaxID=2886935 RepID=A0A9X1SDH1_9MICC|nr:MULTISPECIES: ABC transporter ATP-binding protein [Arthrobacter]MCC3280943.1 ABC transporter ATP-binding protein [Arthrobacter caoxuetaonis]MCC3296804.1 ABC transporter ATP-binding protein [Arthrobacter caoxuetaonis]MCC9192893.1 ABC transporter ATP-binding protein [Arthrobacter sp. zg-Y916]USQ56378.1 ABC transporter ATP-binding protein [Arthrobacter caoxuetaonis]
MDSPNALELSGVGLMIGGARILEDISFTVPQGEMVGVIGPNGAGKTTLFNVISGLLRPTEGTVAVSGNDVGRLAVHRRAAAGLGRTFQTSSLFPQLSVLENVRLAAQARLGGSLSLLRFPHRGDGATRIAERHLEEAGIAGKAGTAAGGLSHGDKRKVEIAMLLAADPEVILLDEPMAGVGSGDVPALSEVIRRMHRDSGRTVLMVEHHMEVVLGLVDRVAVMHHGSLLAIDTPEAVMANPLVQSAYLGEPV